MKKQSIAILTSSRADYGIYLPLLKKLVKHDEFSVRLVVFGMHNLDSFGMTKSQIIKDDLAPIDTIEGMKDGDSAQMIVQNYGRLILSFADYWSTHSYDIIIALGDRFEMSAAVQSIIPFQVPIAHLHGGETTLGAIDNTYRHQISLASTLHFTATEQFSQKLKCFVQEPKNVLTVGALSLDGILDIALPAWSEVRRQFKIPNKKFILITVHPETLDYNRNIEFSYELKQALVHLVGQFHLVITGTNADTAGSIFINCFKELKNKYPDQISLIESLGKANYFAAIKASEMLLGNTSSGIIEAASFGKYVVNVGDRQLGRLQSDNVFNVPFKSSAIVETVNLLYKKSDFKGVNIYHISNSSGLIINHLKNYLLEKNEEFPRSFD